MSGRKHLFLALSRKGWGETTLGLEVARQLRAAGDEVVFLAHSGGLGALAGAGFEVEEVPDYAIPLLGPLLENYLASRRLASLTLCDFLTTNYTMTRAGLKAEALLEYDLPLLAIDTWDYDVTGPTVDVYGSEQWDIGSWIERVGYRLVPVPLGRCHCHRGYRSLPDVQPQPSRVRRHIRSNLGLTESDHAVLVCTANWQHDNAGRNGLIAASSVPTLLWEYLKQVGPSVKLIHVGPARLPIVECDRYLWMPSMTPANFTRLLGSVDLYLTFNLAATTTAAALVLGLPVLAVQNSLYADDTLAVRAAFGGLSELLQSWLRATGPLHPFSVWPLGFRKFLSPLLQKTSYSSALSMAELLDEDAVTTTMRLLLLDAPARDAAVERQLSYVASVHRLPTAADLIDRYLS